MGVPTLTPIKQSPPAATGLSSAASGETLTQGSNHLQRMVSGDQPGFAVCDAPGWDPPPRGLSSQGQLTRLRVRSRWSGAAGMGARQAGAEGTFYFSGWLMCKVRRPCQLSGFGELLLTLSSQDSLQVPFLQKVGRAHRCRARPPACRACPVLTPNGAAELGSKPGV